MIKEVRAYLKERGKAPAEEIAMVLKLDIKMVEHALSLLIKKGEVLEKTFPLPCKTCNCGSTCFEKDTKLYVFLDTNVDSPE